MGPLCGVGVLVTRPQHQSMQLCHLLEAAGATTLRWPVIEITGVSSPSDAPLTSGPMDAFDLIIFTSANAVRFGRKLLDYQRGSRLAAIGPATAHALAEAGYAVELQPRSGFNSEGLLLHPDLQRLTGRRILVVKGMNGRPLLEDALSARGATVVAANVYQRVPILATPAASTALLESFRAGAFQVITATSLEIAEQLLAAATPALRGEFDKAHWLVPSKRVATGIRERGVTAILLEAASAEDHDLLERLVRWRSSVSGA